MMKKILIVDDSLTARHVIKNGLERPDLKVLEACNGKLALQILTQCPDIDLIFTDINMPWMSGLELIEEIRVNSMWRKIPICVTSTDSSPNLMQKAKKLGVKAYLIKPIQTEQIHNILQNFLNKPLLMDQAESSKPAAQGEA